MSNKKQGKPSAEARLAKLVKDQEGLRDPLQLLTSPAIFDHILTICRGYLAAARMDHVSRDQVARFAFSFRQEAFAKFGHDTLETFALGKLVRVVNQSPMEGKGRLDSLSHINGYKQKSQRLDAEQSTAAEHIMRVWDAFGKFLTIGSRGMEGGGGGSKQALQPLDVMGEELWQHHKEIYVPWYNVASKITIARLRGHGAVSLAAIVFKVFVEDYYPEKLDTAFGLCQGETLAAIKAGLGFYWSPEKLASWDEARRAPKQASQPGPSPAKGQARSAA